MASHEPVSAIRCPRDEREERRCRFIVRRDEYRAGRPINLRRYCAVRADSPRPSLPPTLLHPLFPSSPLVGDYAAVCVTRRLRNLSASGRYTLHILPPPPPPMAPSAPSPNPYGGRLRACTIARDLWMDLPERRDRDRFSLCLLVIQVRSFKIDRRLTRGGNLDSAESNHLQTSTRGLVQCWKRGLCFVRTGDAPAAFSFTDYPPRHPFPIYFWLNWYRRQRFLCSKVPSIVQWRCEASLNSDP